MNEQFITNRPLFGAVLNNSHPLAKDLLAIYLFNEGAGLRANDLSPNKRHGTLVKFDTGPKWSTLYGPYHDGTDSQINTTSDWVFTLPLTIIGMINPAGWGGGSAGHIITNGTTALLITDSGGENSFRMYSDGLTVAKAAVNAITLGGKTAFSVTRTSSGITNFDVNNNASGTANQSSGSPGAGTTNIIVGNRNDGARALNSWMPYLALWKVVLPKSYRTAVYLSPYAPLGIPLFI